MRDKNVLLIAHKSVIMNDLARLNMERWQLFFSVGTKFLMFILLGVIRKLKNDLKAARRENLQLHSEMSPTTKIITPKQYTVYIKSKTDWHYFRSSQILPAIFFVLCWKCFRDHTNINVYEQNYEINITWTFTDINITIDFQLYVWLLVEVIQFLSNLSTNH